MAIYRKPSCECFTANLERTTASFRFRIFTHFGQGKGPLSVKTLLNVTQRSTKNVST